MTKRGDSLPYCSKGTGRHALRSLTDPPIVAALSSRRTRMHKSRLATIVIDCQTPQLDEAARFWGAALGRPPQQKSDPDSPNYRQLPGPPDEVTVLIQSVDHPSRVHIDL